MIRRFLKMAGVSAALSALLVAGWIGFSGAQIPGSTTMLVYNPPATITAFSSALRTPASYTTGDLTNAFGRRGIFCVYNQTANAPTPSTTYTIVGKDPVTASYYAIGTQGTAVTTTNATAGVSQSTFYVYPGAPVTANVSNNASLPRTYQVNLTVGGTGSSTGSLGCTLLP